MNEQKEARPDVGASERAKETEPTLDGYWLGENQDEIARFVRGMKNRARQIQLTAGAVGKAAGIGK